MAAAGYCTRVGKADWEILNCLESKAFVLGFLIFLPILHHDYRTLSPLLLKLVVPLICCLQDFEVAHWDVSLVLLQDA